jgi:hypothetical protein
MKPAWLAYPDIPRYSIGWRMGRGEDHYNAVSKMFSGLDEEEQAAYRQCYPEPPEWAGWYDQVQAKPWTG